MSRPLILVDLDGVTYDWAGRMADLLLQAGATHYTSKNDMMASYRTWAIWDDWQIPKGEFDRWWRIGIEQGIIYRTGQIIPGARRALWQLSDAEWDIAIATSRLNRFGLYETICTNTISWLQGNNIPHRQLLFVNDKTRIHADAIVDDKVENMDDTAHARRFVFPANHNLGRLVLPGEQAAAWQNIVTQLTEDGDGS